MSKPKKRTSGPKKHSDAAAAAPGDGWNDVVLELLERRWAEWTYVYPHPDVVLEALERRWTEQREAALRDGDKQPLSAADGGSIERQNFAPRDGDLGPECSNEAGAEDDEEMEP